ncbi:hypothetical protein EKO27_g8077 [Xylaria grammica]|uniref:Manganese lipoxygenase n=1 Tax=Xylaria grammica TaxID=363999 RepID=A0A439CY09_9PEZI|nr:hypothetical protein EKO27_g8077 [Xylaria grammica]
MIKSVITSILLATTAVQASPALTERALEKANNNDHYTLPKSDRNPRARASAIEVKRKGWQYSEYPMGVAYYPTGTLANATIARDEAEWLPPILAKAAATDKEGPIALEAIKSKGGFKKLEDYVNLYDGQWAESFPEGPIPGILTNFTDDRTFSMMRLSADPYRVQRVKPSDKLLFPVDDAAAITGLSLEELQAQGRLFLQDFSEMKELDPTDKFGAGCQGYFYIDPKSDSENDWMLAKMLQNQDSGWDTTWSHISRSHSAAEAPYLAAIRTLSDSHPVLAMLNRIEKTPWNIRPLLEDGVVSGAAPDSGPSYYAWTSLSGRTWANQVYSSGETANFQSNYYRTFLENRGLINSEFGPELKHFPFYEDVAVIVESIREFMAVFVNSYYSSDSAVSRDSELQAWQRETDVAKVYDFPKSIKSRRTLIDILTHQAYLGGVVHGVMSTNGAIGDTTSLPFAPAGAVWQVVTYAAANRYSWKDTNETLSYLFEDQAMLSKMTPQTRLAAKKFKSTMDAFSKEVRARTFDKDGLNRGMPFMWNVLDPNWAPYWSVV